MPLVRPSQRMDAPPSWQSESIVVSGGDVTDFELVIGFPGGTEDNPSMPAPKASLYPNPADRQVTVAFQVESPIRARIDVFDLLGRRVVAVVEGLYYSGRHELTLDASALPSGVYFVRLRNGDRVETGSLVVARS